MLALLPWHWLIKDILAKVPSFLSKNVTFMVSKSFTGALLENKRIEFLRLHFVNNRYCFCLRG